MIFFKSPVYLVLVLFLFLYFVHIIINPNIILLYPILIYPFMFILKSPGGGNIFLSSLPDFTTLISVLYVLIFKIKSSNRFKLLTILLFFHGILTFIISFFHVFNIFYLPIIFRQYTLPILFLYSVIIFSQLSNDFITKALYISLISFTVVSMFAIFNLLNLINFNSTLPELQPVLTIINENEVKNIERSSIFLVTIPRLNLLTGGALGSSAAIFICLALVTYFFQFIGKFYKLIIIIFLSISALLTASVSITTPLFVLFIFYFLFKYKKLYKYLILFLGVIFMLIAYLKFDFNPVDYFSSTVLKSIIGFLGLLDLKDFIFGIGPRITTVGFDYINSTKFFLIDVGLLRVFVETGIFNFIIFLTFILSVFRKGLELLKRKYSNSNLIYMLLFTTICLLVHANFSILPPFYPLFAICTSGILINYNNQIKYI